MNRRHHLPGAGGHPAARNIPLRDRPHWSAKLTRSLTLKDGTKLVTLADARACLSRLGTVTPHPTFLGKFSRKTIVIDRAPRRDNSVRELRAQEKNHRRLGAYDEAASERDQLAAEVADGLRRERVSTRRSCIAARYCST